MGTISTKRQLKDLRPFQAELILRLLEELSGSPGKSQDEGCGEIVYKFPQFIVIRPCLFVSIAPIVTGVVPYCGNAAKESKKQGEVKELGRPP